MNLILEAPAPAAPGKTFRLFIGDLASAQDPAALEAAGITHIVNCCAASCGTTPVQWTPFPELFTYACVHTRDGFGAHSNELDLPGAAEQDPRGQWPAALLVLEQARAAGGAALVHCAWGINRSSTTAIIFLVRAGLAADWDAALALAKGARPVVDPHPEYKRWALAFLAAGR